MAGHTPCLSAAFAWCIKQEKNLECLTVALCNSQGNAAGSSEVKAGSGGRLGAFLCLRHFPLPRCSTIATSCETLDRPVPVGVLIPGKH